MLHFPPGGDLMDVEDVLLGSSEYSVRDVELVSFLLALHCNASNLVLEILKHEKIWVTICTGVPTPNSEGLVPS